MAEVTVRNVVKRYGTVQVMHGVSVDIEDGQFVVLVGPSGCGKSTLLRMIAGLEAISDGEISIGGRVVNDVMPKDRDIAMVFQSYALYPHKTVGENMGFALKIKGAPKAEIAEKVGRAAVDPRPRPPARPLPQAALRRPAPARRHGPRHRPRPGGLPVRRAALQPRRQAPRRHARRDQGAAPAARDHHRLRHPRPDRGDDHGRQDRRDARRPRRAGRRAARSLRQPAEHLRRRLHRLAGDELHQGQGRGRRPAPSSPTAAPACRSPASPPSPAAPVVYGIRPEHIDIGEGGVPARVSVLEPTGSETQIFARHRRATRSTPSSRTGSQVKPGDEIPLRIDPRRAHVFDGASGARGCDGRLRRQARHRHRRRQGHRPRDRA